jgi:hypothetical protein
MTAATLEVPTNIIRTGLLDLPELVVYEHINWGGAEWRLNLNAKYVGDAWNDRISSIVIVRGVWRFFLDSDFRRAAGDLGPGYYDIVEKYGIPNDAISSFQCIQY